MKFVVLIMALASAFPLSLGLRGNAAFARLFWTLFGLLPFLAAALPLFDIGIISWAGEWVGFVYSLEITIVDILALAALLAVPGGPVPWAYKVPLLIYIAVASLSIFQATEPLATTFGIWQFMRMFLVVVAVTRAARHDPKVVVDILRGMAIGMGMNVIAVVYQRFGLDLTQTRGLFVHQNTLGLTTHFVLFPHLAMLLYGYGRLRYLVPAIMATVLVVIFTASRAAVGLAAIGMIITYCALALAGLTQRKVMLALAAAVALAAVAPVAISTFQNRFEAVPLTEEEYDERAAFELAASYIVADYPAGVGVNHYVYIAKNFGYSERANVSPSEGNRNNIVHNAYWLATVETGYLGLFAFVLMLAVPLITALKWGWRERMTAEGNLLLGMGVAMLIAYVHSMYEWVIFAREIQYLLFSTMGMAFGLSLRAAVKWRTAPASRSTARSAYAAPARPSAMPARWQATR
ncbi:O-antigen ligase family protein [Aminobacter sp. Piv2-1]|uniref:O-antigen ligase family protein n=1 Tax=Aminobacter sp. Piv2-1 TaxID=3031122 RepID=UPI0030AF6080